MFSSLFQVALIAGAAINTVAAIPTISIKGSKFFAGGQQFFLKGVAYQGTPADPLVDTTQCTLDAALMKTIGTNSIRVYHIDPTANHDGCMSAFSDAGIYVWLDLDTFTTSIPSAAPTWTQAQFQAFAKVMDIMQKYDNTAGFWVGNEVIASIAQSPASPYIKAAVSDMKSYMALKEYRTIPLGYSAADIAELRPMLQNYLACSTDASQNIDFFGLNSYEWCGDSSYTTSGYSNLQAMSLGYSIPIFFSETGCNEPSPRLFTDQAAIFGPEMIDTWSGSIIYEWVQEVNNYGLVNYTGGEIYNGAPIAIQPGFNNLANQWKNITPTGIAESAYTPKYTAPACPSATGGWTLNGAVAIPTLDKSIISAAAGSSESVATNVTSAASSTVISSVSGQAVATPAVVVVPGIPNGNATSVIASASASGAVFASTAVLDVTTVVVLSATTICPYTATHVVSGSTSIETGITTSTIPTTVTSIFKTTSTVFYSSAVVDETTIVVTASTTICPYTLTHVVSGSTSIETGVTTSVIAKSVTSVFQTTTAVLIVPSSLANSSTPYTNSTIAPSTLYSATLVSSASFSPVSNSASSVTSINPSTIPTGILTASGTAPKGSYPSAQTSAVSGAIASQVPVSGSSENITTATANSGLQNLPNPIWLLFGLAGFLL